MGDRISIQFKNGDDLSVVLFSHWDGMDLVKRANKYIKELEKEVNASVWRGIGPYPLQRYEPGTVMIDFLRSMFKDSPHERISGNYYLGATPNDGDNSDNGHHIINLKGE